MSNEHTVKSYEEELRYLIDSVIKMGSLTESQLVDSMDAVIKVDKDSIDVLSAIHDSYPKLSFYTPTGDSTHGSIVLQDNALIKYDSIGALP